MEEGENAGGFCGVPSTLSIFLFSGVKTRTSLGGIPKNAVNLTLLLKSTIS